jgi:hypothetical protein
LFYKVLEIKKNKMEVKVKEREKETKEFQDVFDFLFNIKLEQYYDKFEGDGYEDIENLLNIKDEDLKNAMPNKPGHVNKFKLFVHDLKKEKVSLYKI